jgi:hypothetical protein
MAKKGVGRCGSSEEPGEKIIVDYCGGSKIITL